MNIPRFSGQQNKDNTDRRAFNDYQAIPFAGVIAFKTSFHASFTLARLLMTAAATININVGDASNPPLVGDRVGFLLENDGTGRTLTFGTGFAATSGTIATNASKTSYIEFMFNGTAWLEISRSVAA